MHQGNEESCHDQRKIPIYSLLSHILNCHLHNTLQTINQFDTKLKLKKHDITSLRSHHYKALLFALNNFKKNDVQKSMRIN